MGYRVTGYVRAKGRRDILTRIVTKAQAEKTAKIMRRDMRIAIPKYQWVSNIKIEKVS